MHYEQDKTQLEIYNEGRERRVLAGTLRYDKKTQRYYFRYEKAYLLMKSAISLGLEFPMSKLEHVSKKNKLFPSLLDRLPDKRNPAYEEYCEIFGLSPDESNMIVLLTTLGRRGPSTFINEPVYVQVGKMSEELLAFRKKLGLSRWDFAVAFDITELTILRVETDKTTNNTILQLIHHYLTFPKVALAQLELTGKKLHVAKRRKLYAYYKSIDEPQVA